MESILKSTQGLSKHRPVKKPIDFGETKFNSDQILLLCQFLAGNKAFKEKLYLFMNQIMINILILVIYMKEVLHMNIISFREYCQVILMTLMK